MNQYVKVEAETTPAVFHASCDSEAVCDRCKKVIELKEGDVVPNCCGKPMMIID